MSLRTLRPLVFRRPDETEENFLILMHYLAMTLWTVNRSTEAVRALQALLPGVGDTPTSLPGGATEAQTSGSRLCALA